MVYITGNDLSDHCCARFEDALDAEEIVYDDVAGAYYWADDEPGYRPIRKCPFCKTPLDITE